MKFKRLKIHFKITELFDICQNCVYLVGAFEIPADSPAKSRHFGEPRRQMYAVPRKISFRSVTRRRKNLWEAIEGLSLDRSLHTPSALVVIEIVVKISLAFSSSRQFRLDWPGTLTPFGTAELTWKNINIHCALIPGNVLLFFWNYKIWCDKRRAARLALRREWEPRRENILNQLSWETTQKLPAVRTVLLDKHWRIQQWSRWVPALTLHGRWWKLGITCW